jgi:UDP-2,3-diacylglucosamine pyrophosphatase LpxH
MWALLLCLSATLSLTAALPQCASDVVNIPNSDSLTFAVVGDWGRVGGEDSMFNKMTVDGCERHGYCCSNLQQADFPDDFGFGDIIDGPQQKYAATLLNEVCGEEGCQFIVGMGDNFYPCGADAFESGLNRFASDWQDVYQTTASPYISNLTWYNIVGNHDYGFNSSVDLQLEYAKTNSKWVFPEAYYSKTFVAGNVSMTVNFLDETPFIGPYLYPKPNTAYYTEYLASKMTPAYVNSAAPANSSTGQCTLPDPSSDFIQNIPDNATGQIPWLKSCLETSNSTWNVVNGHFALYGSDVNWAEKSSKSAYPGLCGAFASVADLLTEYGVDAYVNGHDHTQTHADPLKAGVAVGEANTYGNVSYLVSGPHPRTQYFTNGNGGSIHYGDGVTLGAPKTYNNFSDVVYNQNIQYSSAVLSVKDGLDSTVGEGFTVITADACNMVAKFYNIQNYLPGASSMTPAHTVVIDKCGTATLPGSH